MPEDLRIYRAIELTRQAFKLDSPALAYAWDNLASVPFQSSTAAGWGFGKAKKGDPGIHRYAIRRAVGGLHAWIRDPASHRYHPDLAFKRTQLGTILKPKIRHTWGKAFDNLIIEGITACPLIEAYAKKGHPLPLGPRMMQAIPCIIGRVMEPQAPGEYRLGIGIDISTFDASVQPWLINLAFDILEENLIFPDYYARQSFAYSKQFFIHTVVVMPDGRMWRKHVGVPSGSYYTQLIDSVVNYISTCYAFLCAYKIEVSPWVLGDDSLTSVPITMGSRLPALADAYLSIGFTVHPDKCEVSASEAELKFLGHYRRHSRVNRDDLELLRLSLLPEYPVRSIRESIERIQGLLIDSALNSWPMYHLYYGMLSRYHPVTPSDTVHDTDWHWRNIVFGADPPTPNQIDILKVFTVT
jgi:hypothetical protein